MPLLCLLCGQRPLSLASLLLISSHGDCDRGGRAEDSLPAKFPSHAPHLVRLAQVWGHCLVNSWLSAVLFQKLGALVYLLSAEARGSWGHFLLARLHRGEALQKAALGSPEGPFEKGCGSGGEKPLSHVLQGMG